MSDATQRAEQAKYLLGDVLLSEILDSIEQAAVDAWATTAMADVELREMAYHSLKASRRIRETLKSVVDNGLVEAARAVRR